MTDAAICPACVALPDAPARTAGAAGSGEVVLSLPGIHCAACIQGVERVLLACDGVKTARVNLSRRQVRIGTDGAIAPEPLIAALQGAGYAAQLMDTGLLSGTRDEAGRDLLLRIAVSGFAMMNVMLLSVAVWSGAVGATQHLFHLISAAIAVPALTYAAQPFFQQAWAALRHARLNMDVPISLAILLAASLSGFEALTGGAEAYFDAALSLTFFLLVGRYLDHRTRAAARSAAAELAALEVPRVLRLTAGGRETVDLAIVRPGDLLRVLPGDRMPVDGFVAEGQSTIDRSLLTGESAAIVLKEGGPVCAGEINLTAPITVRVTRVGEDTTLRRMVSLVEGAERVKNRYTALADRAAAVYAPVVHLLAGVAFLGWLWASGDAHRALTVAIAVLIITCPCALGLAVPAVSTTAAGRLFRDGMLVKDGTALERLAEVDTVVFDKTGTLTQPVADISALSPAARGVAAALTRDALHPVARALAVALAGQEVRPARLTGQQDVPGKGLQATWRGVPVRLGSGAWLGAGPGTWLQIGGAAPEPIVMTSALKPGASALVQSWRERGLELRLLSGDTAEETGRTARALGIPLWQAGVDPASKVAALEALAADRHKVAMVGDGLNDTGALAAAYASIAPASAADAARTAADVVFLGQDLRALAPLPEVARMARRVALQNFGIAACYNAVAIPVALAGFATPLLAAIAMSASSITVLLNALRLRGAGRKG